MTQVTVKPGDKLVKGYYEVLGQYGQLNIDHEQAVRSAFQGLLRGYSKKLDWTLVPEYALPGARGKRVVVDGALLDYWKLRRGFWEAKDEKDDLDREIRSKIEKGYPTSNIIFQSPERAVLFQHGVRQGLNEDIRDAKNLTAVLNEFFTYREPDHEEWESAVTEFKLRIPEIAERAEELIHKERKGNKAFIESFDAFYTLCKQAINPGLSAQAVEKMLIQHLLTERIFRRVFHAEEFRSRNVIAAEIEKVIQSMASKHFSRDTFLSGLDRFYKAIERAADDKDDYSEKQAFLNNVYERFFQGYSPKEADTHGIVYTPQPIVDFMVRSVEDILQKEFGKSLADKGVHILDPFVGTGNFITRVMRQIAETKKSALPWKYEHELHCNEIMLLPYYIASMNIEHEYNEHTGEYKPFDGICLVDTFELAEPEQGGFEFMSAENTARVKKQKAAPITVVIGNPPYNAGQDEENDNNKNRKYPVLDRRVAETYSKDSNATNKNALSDPYVKALRWASDRIGTEGVVALVTNNSFFRGISFDGVRKHLAEGFNAIYHFNLKGDARTSGERRRQEGGNIFNDQIRVSVGITLLVRTAKHRTVPMVRIFEIADYRSSEEKAAVLLANNKASLVPWINAVVDRNNNWIVGDDRPEFSDWIVIGSKLARNDVEASGAIFKSYGAGVATSRDVWAYNSNFIALSANITRTVEFYNQVLDRWARSDRKQNIDSFVPYDDSNISWSRDLKADLIRLRAADFDESKVRLAQYRPFSRRHLFFDRVFNEEVYSFPNFFPAEAAEHQNFAIGINDIAARSAFGVLVVDRIADLHLCSSDRFQCFPFYVYDEDGSNRRENITDWALTEFRTHYKDKSITKWDIFHYVYALLHHPEYRERYAANLKRELPRIPYVGMGGIAGGIPSAAKAASVGADYGTAEAVPLQSKSVGAANLKFEGAKGIGGRRYPKLTEEAKRSIIGQVKEMQDAGELHCANQDDARVFHAFAKAGERLADLHVNYEKQPEYPLERIESSKEKLNWRVEKMRLGKDKSSLFYNTFFTLSGIPAEAYEYRLGNRSALEWVIDQYQVSTDKRSGITNDPNREDDEEYIVRLIGQVVYVSVETVKIVKALPELGVREEVVIG